MGYMPPVWRRARRLPLLSALLAGCSILTPADLRTLHAQEHELHCARASMGASSPYRMPLAPPLEDPAALATLDVLPPEARHAARAAGLEPLLVDLLRARAELPVGAPAAPHAVQLQQELTLRLIAFDSQVSSLAFEVSCTRQRISTLLSTLDRREGARQFTLAAASLIVGAVTGIASGVWGLKSSQTTNAAYLGIAGGVATTALGAAALVVPPRWVRLQHEHNLLRPMVLGADPDHLYPSFVFRMMTAQYPGESSTTQAALLADFNASIESVSGWKRERIEETVFGDGGDYDRSLLELREDLMRTLESAVQGVARQLELLDRALVRSLAGSGSPPPAQTAQTEQPRAER